MTAERCLKTYITTMTVLLLQFPISANAISSMDTICTPQHIGISLPLSAYKNKIAKLHLNDPKCKAFLNATHVTLRASLSECKTKVLKIGQNYEFSNSVHGIDPVLTARCVFPVTLIDKVNTKQHGKQKKTVDIKLKLYRNGNFSSGTQAGEVFPMLSTSPSMYFTVSTNHTQRQQCMMVQSCSMYVYNSLGEFKVPMIENGIPNKSHTVIMSRMHYKISFKFNSHFFIKSNETDATFRVACVVRLFQPKTAKTITQEMSNDNKVKFVLSTVSTDTAPVSRPISTVSNDNSYNNHGNSGDGNGYESRSISTKPSQCTSAEWMDEYEEFSTESTWRLAFHEHLLKRSEHDQELIVKSTNPQKPTVASIQVKRTTKITVKEEIRNNVQSLGVVICLYLALVIVFTPFCLYYIWDLIREKYYRIQKRQDQERAWKEKNSC